MAVKVALAVNVGFNESISYSIQSLRTLVLFDRSLLLHFYPTNPDVIPPTDFVESRIAHHYSGYEFMIKEGGELAFVCFDRQGRNIK